MEKEMAEEIAAVYSMGIEELQEKFEGLYGFRPGQTSVVTVRNRIIYRIQENYLGGVFQEDIDFLNELIANDPLANLVRKQPTRISKTVGARYTRMWRGKKYEVIIRGENKFEMNGKLYTSLSAAARAITGTRWNGKLFFGVK